MYRDYKLKLKAYSKKRFDPFCRWDRINVPYGNEEDKFIQTTIGQLNFFKWALENKVVKFIEENYDAIEHDMNSRNSTAKNKSKDGTGNKTRKKREELSVSAVKTVKKERRDKLTPPHTPNSNRQRRPYKLIPFDTQGVLVSVPMSLPCLP